MNRILFTIFSIFILYTSYAQEEIWENGNFTFSDTTFNFHSSLVIRNAYVTLTRCKLNFICEYDQQYDVTIAGNSTVVLDSSILQGVNYQIDMKVNSEAGYQPTVTLQNGSKCLMHAGFDFFNQSVCNVYDSEIGEVQAHDSVRISMKNANAYVVLFFPQGTYSVTDLDTGINVTNIIQLPGKWQVNMTDCDIGGYQFDLFTGTTLVATNCYGVVLSIHTPGDLSDKVSESGLTDIRTGTFNKLGPKFNYTNCDIAYLNIYVNGTDKVELYDMKINESEAHDRSILNIGKKGFSTTCDFNLMQSDGRAQIHLTDVSVTLPTDGFNGSALISDTSHAFFENMDLAGLYLTAQGFGRICLNKCTNLDTTRLRILENGKMSCELYRDNITDSTRRDSAVRITNCYPKSCQNPCFSPDGEYIVYTRFLEGYNMGYSEIVKIRIDGTQEQIIVPHNNSSNVNVPFGSWIGNKICFASDRAGGTEEIWMINDDGTGLTQITSHAGTDYYFEPVFNPQDINKILFEHVPDSVSPHRIALLQRDFGNQITYLTDGTIYDDRLPSWSNDGSTILWQRIPSGLNEGWEIMTAKIKTGANPSLTSISNISNSPSDETDCSWDNTGKWILSSSNYGSITTPNIFAFSSDGLVKPVRKTISYQNQDGAPSISPDGHWIAFESHSKKDENEPSQLWIIANNDISGAITDEKNVNTIIISPNPFSQSTVISYQLSVSSSVKIDIYNSLGENITTLVDEWQDAGSHNAVFDVGTRHAVSLPSGMYFYRIQMGERIEIVKMILIK